MEHSSGVQQQSVAPSFAPSKLQFLFTPMQVATCSFVSPCAMSESVARSE